MNEPRVMPSAENLIKIVEAKEAAQKEVGHVVTHLQKMTELPLSTVKRTVQAAKWLALAHDVTQLPPRWQGLIAECDAILRDRRVGAGLARREG